MMVNMIVNFIRHHIGYTAKALHGISWILYIHLLVVQLQVLDNDRECSTSLLNFQHRPPTTTWTNPVCTLHNTHWYGWMIMTSHTKHVNSANYWTGRAWAHLCLTVLLINSINVINNIGYYNQYLHDCQQLNDTHHNILEQYIIERMILS